MNCLVVVDAWKHCEKEDVEKYPWLENETKLFGAFINSQLKQINNCDIFQYASGREIMEEMETGVVVNDIPQGYNNHYYCGFHLGRCISRACRKQSGLVVLNLSMLFPDDSFHSIKKEQYCWYSHAKGFEIC